MINHIIDNIYLGDWQDAYYDNKKEKKEFGEIFTVAKDSPFVGNHYYGLVDGYYQDNEVLLTYAILDVIKTRESTLETYKILVHCISGFSRAPTVISGYMISKYDITIEDSIYYMKKIRPLVNPNSELLRLLRIYEEKIKK